MRRVGLEPTRSKAITGSLVLRVCQFRHPRLTQELVYHLKKNLSTLFLKKLFLIQQSKREAT